MMMDQEEEMSAQAQMDSIMRLRQWVTMFVFALTVMIGSLQVVSVIILCFDVIAWNWFLSEYPLTLEYGTVLVRIHTCKVLLLTLS